jgi:SAM-dependent methyltransferase
MKARESGMPAEDTWSTFFDPCGILAQFLPTSSTGCTFAEFGSGYGTFTLPAARLTRGLVHAFDIEPALIALLGERARAEKLPNIRPSLRDFVAHGTGLPDATVDHAMLYNILHLENPAALLREAHRILHPGGKLSIIHWNYDPATLRGPPMNIRPRPGHCRAWAEAAGFTFVRDADFSAAAPHHYGLLLQKA